LPPRGVLIVNLIFFTVVFAFAVLGYFSEALGKAAQPLGNTDASRSMTIFIIILGSAGIAALIYGRAKKFFPCWYQGLRAAIGTTLLLTFLYAIVWSLIQVVERKQHFVLFHPRLWNMQGSLNNLKYGSVILLFSSALSVLSSLAISLEPGYDFTPFISHLDRWKAPVRKLSDQTALSFEEHTTVVESTEGMLAALKVAGHMQPVSRAAIEPIPNCLLNFQHWYDDQTESSYLDCNGLDLAVENDVQMILSLC
jgi:hypothetical protein